MIYLTEFIQKDDNSGLAFQHIRLSQRARDDINAL